MKIHINNALDIITSWVDEVVMPKSTPMQKMMITLAILQRGNELSDMLKPIADSNGYIDSDNLVAALDKAGGSITIPTINWNFDRADLDKLIEKAKAYGST